MRSEALRRVLLGQSLASVAPLVVYPTSHESALSRPVSPCVPSAARICGSVVRTCHVLRHGGYAAAHAAKVWSAPPANRNPLRTAVGASMGVVVGAIADRRQGIYFAMTHLGIGALNYFVCLKRLHRRRERASSRSTGRALGVSTMKQYDGSLHVVPCHFLGRLFRDPSNHSTLRWGGAQSNRDHESRALSLGYEADHYKLMPSSFGRAH